MKKLMNKISYGILSVGMALVPAAAVAETTTDSGVPVNLNPVNPPTDLSIAHILVVIILWVLGFSAAVAVLFLILGGLQFVSSAGNADRVTKAKQTILYAVLGIIVIVLAYVIVVFINNNLTSAVTPATTPAQ